MAFIHGVRLVMMLSIYLIICLMIYDHQINAYRTMVKNMTLDEDTFVIKKAIHAQSNSNKTTVLDDIIELNVGGEKITTLRSTLTVVPHSKLSLMFNKDETKKTLPIDKQGAVFFDYNPIYFNYLLDQLRMIKRMPKKSIYQVQFSPPFLNTQVNFTHMLVDLGLTPDHFLSPTEGTHINLTVNSIAGWQECYRQTYDVPFDLSVLTKSCNGSRLLVACRPVNNKKILTLAAIGQREDILRPCLPKQCKVSSKSTKKIKEKLICSSRHQCITQAKRGVGWYHVSNQTWGFVRGSLSFAINPCDSSNLDSDYRLCWTLQSHLKQTSGDRCGNTKNLQKSKQWERLIYDID